MVSTIATFLQCKDSNVLTQATVSTFFLLQGTCLNNTLLGRISNGFQESLDIHILVLVGFFKNKHCGAVVWFGFTIMVFGTFNSTHIGVVDNEL